MQAFPFIASSFSSKNKIMIYFARLRTFRLPVRLNNVTRPLQSLSVQSNFVPKDPNAEPQRYKYPPFYDPYGPRPPPSDKIIQLADRILTLSPEELMQITPALRERLNLPKLQPIDGLVMDVQGGAVAGSGKAEEEKAEKTAFDVKLEKFDASSKIKVIKEIRGCTSLGLKEAKELVEKLPVVFARGVTKEAAEGIIEKVKAAGGVAVMV